MTLLPPCLCYSGKSYTICCKPFHQGKPAPNALMLMRSRYSAYALGISAYIMKTTHLESPHRKKDVGRWKREIEEFAFAVRFTGLTILEFQDGDVQASVRFIAHLDRNGNDVSFQEKSLFYKSGGRWLYHSGEHESIARNT